MSFRALAIAFARVLPALPVRTLRTHCAWVAPWALSIAPLASPALALSAPAQVSAPAEVGVEWSKLVDAQTWGFEYPLSVAQSDARVFVGGGRLASPYFVAAYDGVGGDELWRFEAPYSVGLALAAPADGSRVFALAFDSEELAFRRALVIALDGVTGALLWKSYLTSWSPQAVCQPPRALALSPDGEWVFAVGEEDEFGAQIKGFGTIGGFRTSDGQLAWLQRQGPVSSGLWGFEDVAVDAAGARVFAVGGDGLGVGGTLVTSAFDALAGFPLWHREVSAGAASHVSVAPDGQSLVVGGASTAGGPNLYAFSAADGADRWSRTLGRETIDVEFQGELVVAQSLEDGLLPGSQQNQLTTHGLQATDGVTLWSQDLSAPWGLPAGVDTPESGSYEMLAVDAVGGRVFCAVSRGPLGGPEDYQVTSYRLVDGSLQWELAIDVSPSFENQNLRAVSLSPGADRLVLVGDDAQPGDPQGLAVRVLDPDSASEQWLNTWNESSSAANVPVDLVESSDRTRLYFLDRLNLGTYELIALSTETGEEQWRTAVDFPTWSSLDPAGTVLVTPDDEYVLVHLPGTVQSQVYGFSAELGTLLWSRDAGPVSDTKSGFAAIALSSDGAQVFLGSDAIGSPAGLTLESLETATGTVTWSEPLPSSDAVQRFAGLAVDETDERLFAVGTREVVIGAPAGGDSDLLWYALDPADGQILYEGSFSAQAPETPSFEVAGLLARSPSGGSVTVAGRLLGAVDGQCLATFSTQNGALLWSRVDPGPQDLGLVPRDMVHAVDGSVVVVGSVEGEETVLSNVRIEAFLSDFGVPLWTRTLDFGAGDELVELGVGPDGLTLYGIGTRGLGQPESDELFAFAMDALDGELLWLVSYDSQVVGTKFGGLDDAGHDVCLDPIDNGLFLAGTTWNGEQLADSLLMRLHLPSLYASPLALSLASGGVQSFRLRTGPESAGDLYLVLGSASGTAPGLPLDGLEVPLALDAYTWLTAQKPNNAPLIETLGQLDSLGRAQAALQLPSATNPSLAGVTLHHAFVVLDWFGTWTFVHASNAMPVYLVP